MDWKKFTTHLRDEKLIAKDLIFVDVTPVSGGDINLAYRLRFDKNDFFVKLNTASKSKLLKSEFNNIKAIKKLSTLRCPDVYGVGVYEQNSWLLMEYLHLTRSGDDFARGKDLAYFHKNTNEQNKFGWMENNYIGNTIQYNNWHSDWIEFYVKNRLNVQFDLAENIVQDSLNKYKEKLLNNIDKFFIGYKVVPSLVHGDLWSGNSAFADNRNAVFFDMACYYGDRESDIAMCELFGGFSVDFYKGYNSVYALHKDYEKRKPLYQLYHMLNHLNLFGSSYEFQVIQILEKLNE